MRRRWRSFLLCFLIVIEVEDATRQIIEGVWSGEGTVVDCADSIGCFGFEEIRAEYSIPSFDQSAVDGYALSGGNLAAGARFSVIGSTQAGDAPAAEITDGEAMRLFTGAPIPDGTIAVVMQESIQLAAARNEITLKSGVEREDFIRRKGSALCIGQSIIKAGALISPAMVGLLASQGHSHVTVGSKPRVSVISTGNELAPAGAGLGVGQTYDSNGPMIEAMCRHQGVSRVVRHRCSDSLAATVDKITTVAGESDIIVITGGVSVGDHDFVKPALVESGFSIDFWKVRMKPGKPFLFGRRAKDKKIVLGLPGNPASAFVTFALFGAPAIRRWMGARPEVCPPQSFLTLLAADVANPSDRPQFLRGILSAQGFRAFGGQESHALRSAVRANALVRVEPEAKLFEGERVAVIPLPET